MIPLTIITVCYILLFCKLVEREIKWLEQWFDQDLSDIS